MDIPIQTVKNWLYFAHVSETKIDQTVVSIPIKSAASQQTLEWTCCKIPCSFNNLIVLSKFRFLSIRYAPFFSDLDGRQFANVNIAIDFEAELKRLLPAPNCPSFSITPAFARFYRPHNSPPFFPLQFQGLNRGHFSCDRFHRPYRFELPFSYRLTIHHHQIFFPSFPKVKGGKRHSFRSVCFKPKNNINNILA